MVVCLPKDQQPAQSYQIILRNIKVYNTESGLSSLTDKFACCVTPVKPGRCDNDESTGNATQELDSTSHLYMTSILH